MRRNDNFASLYPLALYLVHGPLFYTNNTIMIDNGVGGSIKRTNS